MSGDSNRPSSSEVAHEAEDTRANLASTLEQLRYNLRPENVMDEVVSNARAGVSSVTDNLVGVAKQYPIPAMLIASGSALLAGLFTKRSRLDRAPSTSMPGSASSSPARSRLPRASSFQPAPGRSTDGVAGDPVRGGLSNLKQMASSAYESTSSQAGDALQSVSRYLPNSRTEVRSKLSNLLDEQPLVLGIIGLAVGAAIGAALPISEAEESLMGETSHRLRESAQGAARQRYEGLRAAAGDAVDNVRHAASDSLTEFVNDVGTNAKAAVKGATGPLDQGRRDV